MPENQEQVLIMSHYIYIYMRNVDLGMNTINWITFFFFSFLTKCYCASLSFWIINYGNK